MVLRQSLFTSGRMEVGPPSLHIKSIPTYVTFFKEYNFESTSNDQRKPDISRHGQGHSGRTILTWEVTEELSNMTK